MSLWILSGGIIAVIGMIFYILSILNKTTIPHRVTRFVQFLLLLLGTIGLYIAHDTSTFILYCIYTTSSLVIFLLTLKHGVGGWAKIDIACLGIALVGVVVWQISGDPVIAVGASLVASLVGSVPAFIKTYMKPKSENWIYYFCNLFSNSFIYFAHGVHTFSNSMYPVYYVGWNMLFLAFIFRNKIKQYYESSLHFKKNPIK